MVSLNDLKMETLHASRAHARASTVDLVLPEEENCKESPSFSLIIPVYNEADIVSKNLDVLERFLERKRCELIVCDDCSKDGTYDHLKTFAKLAHTRSNNPNILLMRSDARIGKGGTIKRAVKEARADVLVIMDVDLSVDLRCIPEMVKQARISGGIVIGQRSTSDRCTQGPLRIMLSLGFNSLARLLFHTGVKDHQCGFKAMKADVARKLAARIKNDGYVFDTELIVLARRWNIPVQQVQARWSDGRPRKSNLKWIRTGFAMMKDLLDTRRNLA
jgi:glycosyltransferase involved in cell wall biosynthesis